MISVETYVLCRNYTNKAVKDVEEIAIEEAVAEAVAIAKEYTDKQVAIGTWKIQFVNVLPPIAEADEKTIYFVPMNIADEENNYYYEYIDANGQWEMIGSTEFNPDNYMTKQEVMDYVNEHQYVLQPATNATLGGVIVDTNSIKLDTDGTISIVPIGTNDIGNLFH